MELFHGNKHAFELDRHIVHHLSLIDRDALGVLAIIQIGSNPSSTKYVNLKLALCSKLGIKANSYQFSDSMPHEELSSEISKICSSPNTRSVIIQLPLPQGVAKEILDLIPLEKDVDSLSDSAQKRFYSGEFTMIPPVVRAVKYFLEACRMNVSGLTVDIVGKGFLVGAPLAYYLEHCGATVTSYDEHDDVSEIIFKSDLVISATGRSKLLQGGNFYHGTSVIDFGSSVLEGKVVGDINLDSETSHLKILSPSPGGLGPLVVRFLLINHLGF